MSHRYFHPDLVGRPSIELQGDEAHHAQRVMRVKVNDSLTLFDGLNHEATGLVVSVERGAVICQIQQVAEVNRESATSVIVAVALPKGDRARSVVEKAVELGASGFVPLRCQRSVALPSGALIRRLNRYVIDASKQCGRNRLMAVAEATSFQHFLDTPVNELFDASALEVDTSMPIVRAIADPSGQQPIPTGIEHSAIFAIGPEGGFDEAEIHSAQKSGWDVISLGPRILRVETAVSMVLAKTL